MGYRAIFHLEFYQRRLERSVLGFGSALPPSLSPSLSLSLRTYDWTHQYADHETWSKPLAPRRPPPPILLLRRSKLASLFPRTVPFSPSSRLLSHSPLLAIPPCPSESET